MVNPELATFTNRWLEKAMRYDDSLDGHFDKFFSLFIVYNRLYNEIRSQRMNEGRPVSRVNSDAINGVDQVYLFLRDKGVPDLTSLLNQSMLNHLENMIETEMYWIILSREEGARQRDKDLLLVTNLRSNGTKKKTIALLKTIYNVRCNMFHGNKGFNQYQRPLLHVLNTLLLEIINIIKENLGMRM